MAAKMNKYDRTHLAHLSKYQRQIDSLYRRLIQEAALLGASVDGLKGDSLFSFDDYPALRKRAERLVEEMRSGMSAVIVNGVNAEWTLANNKNSELARAVFGDRVGKLSQAEYRRYFSTNDKAREAFLSRKEAGLNLSDRVWRYTNQFKGEIELGLDVGIRNGMSAQEMSRELKAWLREPDKLFRRVRDERGELKPSRAMAAYHPGQGVYRSSYKNARRLAATETNIAYRTADYERWQQLPFVVGIRVVLSNNHPEPDICDELSAPVGSTANKGRGCYPKDFKFTGWHPHCRCHAESILKTEEEMAEDTRRILAGEEPSTESSQTVDDVPQEFKDWLKNNSGRIEKAKSLPYFLSDNEGMMGGAFLDNAVKKTYLKALTQGKEVQGIAERIAAEYGASCTPINFKSEGSIKRKVLSERREQAYPVFSPSKLKDTVRTTIVADAGRIEEILSRLEEESGFLRRKDQRTALGYTGHIVNLKTSGGVIAEIQVNTARMIYAKESPEVARSVIGVKLWYQIRRETGLEGGLGHKFYEAYRILGPNSAEAKEILKKSREYYSHFTSR